MAMARWWDNFPLHSPGRFVVLTDVSQELPKTAASARSIPLGKALAETLRIHREKSSRRGPDDFVFYKRDGPPLDPDVLRKDVL